MAMSKDILLNIITFCSVLTTRGSMGVPAIGDVQLVPSKMPGYYQPLVYFTNGIEPPQWGAICYDGVVKADARVLCNQAGFELNDISSFIGLDNADNPYPIWLDDVTCDEDKEQQHILSCDYKVVFGRQTNKWPCSTNKYLIINCDITKPLTSGKYDGQLQLCPPDKSDNTSSKFSTSFGLVIVYSSKYGIWRGFNQPNDSAALRGNEADIICRQLGFTGAIPGSAVTQRALQSNYIFQHCYDDRVQSQAWLPTNEIHCEDSQKCFGCCFNYPSRANCKECDKLNDIVIQCIFIPDQARFSSESGGSADECAYNNLICNHVECASEAQEIKSLTIGVIVSSGLCAVLFIATVSIISCLIYKKCIDLRHNRGALQGQNNPNRVGPGPQPVQIQVPEGPGGQDHPNERDALL